MELVVTKDNNKIKENKMTKKKEIAKRQNAGVPATIDMQADAGAGMEGADKESYALPFLIILQKQSPQIDDIVGAKAGQFFNTVTEELYNEVMIIPCAFQRTFIRWAPRDEGGGFKGQYDPFEVQEFEKDDRGFPCIGDDNLADTRSHFILVKNKNGSWTPAVLSLSSTQVKKSKRWMSQISSIQIDCDEGKFNPPSYSHTYKLTTVKEENTMGKWFGVKIEIIGIIEDKTIYELAKKLNKQVTEGAVKSAEPSDNNKI